MHVVLRRARPRPSPTRLSGRRGRPRPSPFRAGSGSGCGKTGSRSARSRRRVSTGFRSTGSPKPRSDHFPCLSRRRTTREPPACRDQRPHAAHRRSHDSLCPIAVTCRARSGRQMTAPSRAEQARRGSACRSCPWATARVSGSEEPPVRSRDSRRRRRPSVRCSASRVGCWGPRASPTAPSGALEMSRPIPRIRV